MHQPKLATPSPVKKPEPNKPPMDLLGYDLWLYALANHPHARSPQTQNRTGGGERDRTDDLMLAKHALSQLSYTPG